MGRSGMESSVLAEHHAGAGREVSKGCSLVLQWYETLYVIDLELRVLLLQSSAQFWFPTFLLSE